MKKIIDAVQGTEEWHEHRAKSLNASEASAMLGVSSYKTRNELLHEKATGITPEIDDATQTIFDKGHEFEAAARPWAEEIIGEELYPVTQSVDIDGLALSASMDGLNMLEDTCWEHKTGNKNLLIALDDGVIPSQYHPQIEQQLLISGAEKCLFMASSGDFREMRHTWYVSNPDLRKKLISGWKQFLNDVSTYEPVHHEPAAVGAAVDEFPALFIDLTGDVTGTNLAAYEDAVTVRIKSISTDLNTDQDFADAESMVKFLSGAEAEIETVKKQALAKTASIDELFRTVDHLREEMRSKRLALDKLVKARKKEVKVDITMAARKSVDEHIETLNEGLGGEYMPEIITDFNAAMKGKRTVATLQGSADDEVARAKIEASEIAEKIRTNLKLFNDAGHEFLFSDRQQLLLKDASDVETLIRLRISDHEKLEAARIERERKEAADKLAQQAPVAVAQDAESPPLVNTASPAQSAPTQDATSTSGNAYYEVFCVLAVDVAPDVSAECVEDQVRKSLELAGVKSLRSVKAHRCQ